ncbi:ABC transporter permease [Mycoplasma sp. Ms02]|uniref:ABC transporter permease n=1 Tax=Mycoplasma sp. Ms02 TaxID=353851 RepID=UPI001C8AF58C|nr:ABC transporter permease [Mycoplasma sp. Ms02]QZE12065.1 ABC transporter permease [Mycoplasma sp. Ms02]
MWKLFKETWKSLSKNKVAVGGLTVLVFLTSGVFTLLYDMNKSLSTQVEKYDEKSKLHDLTLDLNLPTAGGAFNDGYYINGMYQSDPTTITSYNKPIIYIEPQTYVNKFKTLTFSKFDGDYIPANLFTPIPEKFKDIYFSKSDIQKLFDASKDASQSVVVFDLSDSKNSFTTKQPYDLRVFQKNEDQYSEIIEHQSLELNQRINFDKNYKLSEISNARIIDSKIIVSELSSMYINFVTKEATFDFTKGKMWENQGVGLNISSSVVANLLDLEQTENENIYQVKQESFKTTIERESLTLSNSFLISQFSNTPIQNEISKKLTLEAKKEHIISNLLVVSEEEVTYFNRFNYTITFDDVNSSKWTGVYKTFIENQKLENNGSIPRKFKDFSRWSKNVITTQIWQDEQGNELERKEIANIEAPILVSDLTKELSLATWDLQVRNFRSDIYNFEGSKNIREIENDFSEKLIDDINNASIKDERFNEIKSGSLKILKQIVIEEANRKIGSNNLGYRRSLVAETVNDKTFEKESFLFIDAGDSNGYVQNLKQNVGKLFSEDSNTLFDNYDWESNKFVRSKQITPRVSADLSEDVLFGNFSTDPNNIILDISYEDTLFRNVVSGEEALVKGSKIIKLAKYEEDEENASEINVDSGIAISGWLGKFYFIKYNEKNQRWESLKISNVEKNAFQHPELPEILVSKKLTFKTKYVNPNGWLSDAGQAGSEWVLPIGYRAPKADITNEAINKNSLNQLLFSIQKTLLNSGLVTKGILLPTDLYKLFDAIKITMAENNLVSVIATGQINPSIAPKLVVDMFYHMTHSETGDDFSQLFNNLFNRIKGVILSTPENEREDFLKQNLNGLISVLKVFSVVNFDIAPHLDAIVKSSHDPVVFIDGIQDLFNSFDWKAIFSQMREIYGRALRDETIEVEGEERLLKIHESELLSVVVQNISANSLKLAIFKIIDNLNTDYLLDYQDSSSLISTLLSTLIPDNSTRQKVLNILSVIDRGESRFKTSIEAVKDIIRAFDLNIFASSIEKEFRFEKTDVTITTYDKTIDKYVSKNLKTVVKVLDPKAWIVSAIKALFTIEGSDRSVKDKILEIINVSTEAKTLKLTDDISILIPAKSEGKLGLLEIIELFSGNNSLSENLNTPETTTEVVTTTSENQTIEDLELFDKYLKSIYKLKKHLESIEEVDFDTLQENEKALLIKYFNSSIVKIDDTKETYVENVKTIKKDVFNNTYEEVLVIFDFFKTNATNSKVNSSTNFGDLANQYINFIPSQTNTLFGRASSLIKQFVNYTPQNAYDNTKQVYPLFSLWFNIFVSPEARQNPEKAINFAKALLSHAISEKANFNNTNFIDGKDNNLPLYEETEFSVASSLARPMDKVFELFRKDSDGNYLNTGLNAVSNQFPEFKNFIKRNAFLISLTYAYVAQSEKYTFLTDQEKTNLGIDSNANGIYAIQAQNLIKAFEEKEALLNNSNLLNDLVAQMSVNVAPYLLNIPAHLLKLGITHHFPDLLVWYVSELTTDEKLKNKGNIGALISNKLTNFENLAKENTKDLDDVISSLFAPVSVTGVLGLTQNRSIALDDFYINLLKDSEEYKQNKISVFGINLIDFIIDILNSVTSVQYENSRIKYNDRSSYLAHANFAWMQKNNKEIYAAEIPDNPDEIQELISVLDERYLVDVAGVKYILVGENITADILYPVLDEENTQVNTKNQAILYVNTKGFNRIRNSFQNNNVKEYLLIKSPYKKATETEKLKQDLETFVRDKVSDTTNLQRVFLADELDPVNPERSLRVSVIQTIIKAISSASKTILILLMIMVASAIVFIIGRYIANKNKVLGILVAQGYSTMEIALSFTIFALITALLGGVLGYITGFMLQGVGIKILESYWSLPIVTYKFSVVSFIFTVIVPFVAMAGLIVLISAFSLRFKSLDLMSGISELWTGELFKKYMRIFRKRNVKTKFSASLLANSVFKMILFGFSIILTSITILFGISTFKIFDYSVEKTYENRHYNYRLNLATPTLESGPLIAYNAQDLDKSLYVPIGKTVELERTNGTYFKPGYSEIINSENKNGFPDDFTSHILTQYSVNIKIDGSVSVDPWQLAYGAMPDSQKARVNLLRNKIGHELEKTQEGVYFTETGELDYEKVAGKDSFFHFISDKKNSLNSKFVRYVWNIKTKTFDILNITTGTQREDYRNFLVEGYKKLEKDDAIKEFYISFGGVFFDDRYDEKYTYLSGIYKDKHKISLYGYLPDSQKVDIFDKNGNNLKDVLNNYQKDEKGYVPLVINELTAKKRFLSVGSVISIDITNKVDRYKTALSKLLNEDIQEKSNTVQFKVVGINQTYINEEFIITKADADRIIGLDKLSFQDGVPFNGILSSKKVPEQLIGSTGLYSPSGYYPAISSFDVSSSDQADIELIYKNLFSLDGLTFRTGWSKTDVAKFISNNATEDYQSAYDTGILQPTLAINKFANLYEDTLYVPISTTIDAKDIEVGFIATISQTVQTIVTAIIILGFIITIVILVILSTIMINENEKNIAIWTILGYSQKEKAMMFLKVFLPFILLATIVSVPFSLIIIHSFSLLLIYIGSIAIPISLTCLNVLVTFVIVLSVFLLTSIFSWRSINKIKAIDLLKGK